MKTCHVLELWDVEIKILKVDGLHGIQILLVIEKVLVDEAWTWVLDLVCQNEW